MSLTESLSRDDVIRALEAHDWRFAKSMPQVPHFYTLRKNWLGPPEHPEFETLVQWMRDNGVVMKWGRYKRPYFDANGWRYWTMGAPLPITILINREQIEVSTAVVVPPKPVKAVA